MSEPDKRETRYLTFEEATFHDLYVKREPIQLLIWCPACGARHLDEGEWATKPHHTHSCQECGLTWRPAVQYTVGVQFLPGFKNVSAK